MGRSGEHPAPHLGAAPSASSSLAPTGLSKALCPWRVPEAHPVACFRGTSPHASCHLPLGRVSFSLFPHSSPAPRPERLLYLFCSPPHVHTLRLALLPVAFCWRCGLLDCHLAGSLPAQDKPSASPLHAGPSSVTGLWKQILSDFPESKALDLHVITK